MCELEFFAIQSHKLSCFKLRKCAQKFLCVLHKFVKKMVKIFLWYFSAVLLFLSFMPQSLFKFIVNPYTSSNFVHVRNLKVYYTSKTGGRTTLERSVKSNSFKRELFMHYFMTTTTFTESYFVERFFNNIMLAKCLAKFREQHFFLKCHFTNDHKKACRTDF